MPINKQARNIILAVLALILIAGAAIYLPIRRVTEPGQADAMGPYFQERLTTLGVADVGQPIEGFDAELLMVAFPGLVPGDFDQVDTFDGRYQMTENGLEFTRNLQGPVSSAEKTVSDQGYGRLLQNISVRLAAKADTKEDVDALVERINTSDLVETAIGQSGSAFGVRVIPTELLEDSRCPSDVVCIQAGTVRVQTLLTDDKGDTTLPFTLGQPVMAGAVEVTLERVEPSEKRSTDNPQPSDYRFFYRITKTPSDMVQLPQ